MTDTAALFDVTTPDTPAAARALLRQLDDWSVKATHGSGSWTFSALGEPRGNGTRPKIEVVEDVDSVLIRARHVDGRAFVALWVRRASRKGWALDLAWRARAPHEHTPAPITATQLRAYVGASDPAAALAAVTPAIERKAA